MLYINVANATEERKMENTVTSLFDGVSREEYAAMMVCFKTVTRTYRRGEEIPMPHERVAVVQSGHVDLIKTDINGVRTIFEQLRKGGVFGDVLGYAWADASFFLVAEEDSDILYIDYEHIVKRCAKACTHHSTVVSNLVRLMSEKTQALSEHLEILSRRTTREKLLAYFTMAAAKNENSYFTLPFSQTSLADYICVDRSAMVRELRRMTDEGIIEIERRNVKLKTGRYDK